MKREEISSFEYHDNPLDKGKSIRFFRELFSDGGGRFIVEDELTGLNMVCSSYAFGKARGSHSIIPKSNPTQPLWFFLFIYQFWQGTPDEGAV